MQWLMRLERSIDYLVEFFEGASNVEKLEKFHLGINRLRIEPRNVINYLYLF